MKSTDLESSVIVNNLNVISAEIRLKGRISVCNGAKTVLSLTLMFFFVFLSSSNVAPGDQHYLLLAENE